MPGQYYRFQRTEQLENESYTEFLSDIFFTIGGPDNEWQFLDEEEREEIIEDILIKWEFAIDLWWNKHREKFEDEDFEDEVTYLLDLLSTKEEDTLFTFMQDYKLDGVFAVKAEEFPDKNELIKASVNPELGLFNDNLLLLEGEEIAYFGHEYGTLIKPTKIISLEKVPSEYVKKEIDEYRDGRLPAGNM